MQKPDPNIMRAAIEEAEAHKTPFGAAIAMGDQVVVTAANQTKRLNDPTAHAEVMAIRKLGVLIRNIDFSGYTLYTTCEPCPMCMSAAIWARVDAIVFGCGIPEISEYMPQISMKASRLAQESFYPIQISGGFMLKECRVLLSRFH